MKITITPTVNSQKNLHSLKRHLRRSGIYTEADVKRLPFGHLGRGVVSGLTAFIAGSDGFFTKLGEAIVKYVELKKVDITLKNENGEELCLSAALPKEQIRSVINEFLGKDISATALGSAPKRKKKSKTTKVEA